MHEKFVIYAGRVTLSGEAITNCVEPMTLLHWDKADEQ
jgi:hypothetical protein